MGQVSSAPSSARAGVESAHGLPESASITAARQLAADAWETRSRPEVVRSGAARRDLQRRAAARAAAMRGTSPGGRPTR